MAAFPAVVFLSSLTGSTGANPGFKIRGEASGDTSGESVSTAGDVNGDGFADLIVGSPSHDVNGSNAGAAYVIFGKATGFSSSINLASLNGTSGFQISGELTNDQIGRKVSSAGDFNGDGFADVIVGSQVAEPALFAGQPGFHGVSYIVFGKAAGFAANVNRAKRR